MSNIIQQDGITFNNVYKDGGINLGDTIKQGSYNPNKLTPSGDNFPLVNAVDIDWNDPTVPTIFSNWDTSIRTTGNLINWLKSELEAAYIQNQSLTERIVKLETLVSGLYSALADDTSNS